MPRALLDSPAGKNRPDASGTLVGVAPVRLVILGANFGAKIARQLRACAKASGAVLVAGVCDLDEAKARVLAGELSATFYPHLDAVLSDPSVEAVGVFTGPVGRGRLIERILAAGKDVMSTKPFELEPAEAARAFAAATRHGRVLHLNSPAPTLAADLAWIQGWLADGTLGRPVAMHARTWADYHEQADGSWLDDPRRCPGGPLFRLGVYFLNDFSALLGRPIEVCVQHARVRTGRPSADNAQISIRYESGALGNIFASFCVGDGQPYRDEVVLACERGTVRRWMTRSGGVDMDKDRAIVELQRPGKPLERLTTEPGDYAGWYNWSAFQAAVRRLPGAVARDAGETEAGVRLLHAMSRAAISGLPERV